MEKPLILNRPFEVCLFVVTCADPPNAEKEPDASSLAPLFSVRRPENLVNPPPK